MLLLQFSTSHYCRKARLALGYKRLAYQVENLTPGLHALKLKPLTGDDDRSSIATPANRAAGSGWEIRLEFFIFLDCYQPEPGLGLTDFHRKMLRFGRSKIGLMKVLGWLPALFITIFGQVRASRLTHLCRAKP